MQKMIVQYFNKKKIYNFFKIYIHNFKYKK